MGGGGGYTRRRLLPTSVLYHNGESESSLPTELVGDACVKKKDLRMPSMYYYKYKLVFWLRI